MQMRNYVWAAVALLATIDATRGNSVAQMADRSGVRPEVLSLPSGPGSIEGLGESFEPNPNTGTSGYAVPIQVSPGVVGFQPSINLRYSSGGGNSELGIGWSMGLPMVQRSTDDGLPSYDARDSFVLRGMEGRGAEDLVRLADGSYRFRIEGAFARGRQRDDGSWEFRSKSGTRFRFGTTETAMIRDGVRVFTWCLTEQEDLRGHVIRYEYTRTAGHPFLSRIVYNDFGDAVRNEVRFTYEDRPDAVTSFLPTFADTITQRLSRIDVMHGGALVRRYDLGFQMMSGLSRMTTVRMVGTDGMTALPTLSMRYVPFDPTASAVVSMENAPARALGSVAEISDVNGDALPDLLVADPGLDGGRYSWVENLDGVRFGERHVMTTSPSIWLGSPEMQLADVDGDGVTDVLARVSPTSDGTRYYRGQDDGFGSAVILTGAPSAGFADPDVQLVDLDHDKRTDILRIDPTSGEISVSFARDGNSFSPAATRGRLDPAEVLSFSRSGLRLADMNGDGLSDLVAIRSGSLRFWASRGSGNFEPSVNLSPAPTLSEAELASIQVRDLDGDGTSDLVHVGVSRVRYWLNLSGTRLDVERTVDGTPEVRPTTVIRVADVNGNGTADIVWIDPAGTTPWRYLDVHPRGTPGLLAEVDNGLGRVTRVEYAGIGEMRRWGREEGVSWTNRSPIGQTLLHRIRQSSGLDPEVLVELRYTDGYYDGAEREFRGFAHAFRFDVGDAAQPTLVTESTFDIGTSDEALKGMVLTQTRRDESGGIFDVERSQYVVRTVATAEDGTPLRFAFRSVLDREHVERSATPVTTRETFDFDDYGNETRRSELGIVEGSDLMAGNDERVTVRTFAMDMGRWIVDRVGSERVEDLMSRRFSERHTFYDGEAHRGLGLGQLGEFGEVTREETWVDAERFVLVESKVRDSHGNPIEIRVARGGLTVVEMDPESHSFVREERRQQSDGGFLVFHAEHDRGLGVMRSLRDPNDQLTQIEYDALGRVISLVDPGDSVAQPTRHFTYTFGAPLSTVRAEQRTTSGTDEVLVTIEQFDGLGRKRGAFQRDAGGRWAASARNAFGPRGLEAYRALPTFERSADVRVPLATEPGVASTFDALGRMVRELESDGSERRMTYTPLAVATYDENDSDASSMHTDTPTTRTSDGLGRVVSVVEREGAREVLTRFGYDPRDLLVRMTDAAGRSRSYAYDGRSLRTRIDDPNAGTWRIAYNDAGDLDTRTDAVGNTVRYTYDTLGRPLTESHRLVGEASERAVTTFHYDTAASGRIANFVRGQLAYLEDAAGAVFFGYDERGRMTERTRRFADGTEHTTWSTFDAASRTVARGFPNASHLTIAYDERGLLASVGGIVSEIENTAWGALSSASFGNGVRVTRGYDARQRLETMGARSDRAGLLVDLRYELDRASRVVGVMDRRTGINADLSLTATHTFDDRYRLTRSMDAQASTTWAYDDVGNITSITSGHADPFLNATSAFGERGAGPDQLTTITFASGNEMFSYDAAGRMTQDGTRTLTYDAKGRLARVVRGTTTEEYVYGFDDERAIKRTTQGGRTDEVRYIDRDVEVRNGRVIRYVFLGEERAVRLDALTPTPTMSASITGIRTLTVFGAIGLLLLVVLYRRRLAPFTALGLLFFVTSCDEHGNPTRMSTAITAWPDEAVLYLSDVARSPILLADARGVATEQWARYPYGGIRGTRGTGEEPFGYVGNELDQGAALSDFNARPYRPELSRFLAVEPRIIDDEIGAEMPHEWQAYSYAAGDPVNGADGSGRFVLAIGVSISFTAAPINVQLNFGGAVGVTPEGISIGAYVSVSGGLAVGAGGSVGIQATVLPHPNSSIEDMGGLSVSGGFTASGGAGVSVDVGIGIPGGPHGHNNQLPGIGTNPNPRTFFVAVTGTAGTEAEVHGGVSRTWSGSVPVVRNDRRHRPTSGMDAGPGRAAPRSAPTPRSGPQANQSVPNCNPSAQSC